MVEQFTERNPFLQVYTPAGRMIYELISQDNINFKFSFLIKEETKYINKYKYNPAIEVRIGMIKIDDIFVLISMLLINRDFDMLYEMFFNYHQTENGEISDKGHDYLSILSKQNEIPILFYNEDNKRIRNLIIKNNIKEEVFEMLWRLTNTKPWTMKEFDIAKEKIYKIYPSPMDIWNHLTKIKFNID
jgi:hypothetical protein